MKSIEQTIEDTLKKYSRARVDIASEVQDLLYGDEVISRIYKIKDSIIIERGKVSLIYNKGPDILNSDANLEEYLLEQLKQHTNYAKKVNENLIRVYNDNNWFSDTENRLQKALTIKPLYTKLKMMLKNIHKYHNLAKSYDKTRKIFKMIIQHSLETQIVTNDILDDTISDCKKFMENEFLPKIADKDPKIIDYAKKIIALQKHIIDVHYRIVQDVGMQLNVHQEWIQKYL